MIEISFSVRDPLRPDKNFELISRLAKEQRISGSQLMITFVSRFNAPATTMFHGNLMKSI
jgi:hypothetical protein